MSEKELKKKVFERLRPYFHIFEEINGTHFSGKKFRIDAVIKPIDNTDWKNPNISFGIEFKKPSIEYDIRGVTGLIRQAYDYQYTVFEKFGKIPILICPLKLHPCLGEGSITFARHLIGKFGIGEISNPKHRGLSIVFQESHYIWDERDGVTLGKRWAFLDKDFPSDVLVE